MSRINAALHRSRRINDDPMICRIEQWSRDAAMRAICAELERLDHESRICVLRLVVQRYDEPTTSPEDNTREPVGSMISGFAEALRQLAREWNGD